MLSVIIIVLVTIVVGIVVFTLLPVKAAKTKTTIPGLTAVDEKNGNLAELAASGSLQEFLVKLHREHGPIVSFWFGTTFTVSVASPELFKELRTVFDRPDVLFRLFEPMISEYSIQYTNGQEGQQRRKSTDHAWSHDMLRYFCENFNELGEEMVTKLSALPEKEHVPLCQHTLSLTIKGLSRTALGDYFKDDAKCNELIHNYKICWHEMEGRVDGNMPEAGSLRERRFDESLRKIKNMVKDIVKHRKENPPKPHEKAFIDILIENTDIYSEPKLLAECVTYMTGGFHTSGHLLCWILYYLTLDKDVQEQVYQEVMSVVGSTSSIAPEDINKFQYTKQVIDESMRLSILAPWAAKVQDKDVTLGGHNIPKGTPVITAIGVLHQDEKMWPNPNKFDPDRFSPENVKSRNPYIYQPFGLPGRICPGYRFAYYELTVFLAVLIRNFKWTLVGGQCVESSFGLVTSPKEEIWVQIEPRQ